MKRSISLLLALALLLSCCPVLPLQVKATVEEGYYTYKVSNEEAIITECEKFISGNITIPSTLGGYPVTSIGSGAFDCCSELRNVTIPEGVSQIGDYAFNCCTSLESVVLPDTITKIGECAFFCCDSLIGIEIPNGVTVISCFAFGACYSLKSVTIPNSVTEIQESAFGVCNELADVYYGGTKAQWNEIAIDEDNEALLNATLHTLDHTEIMQLSIKGMPARTVYIVGEELDTAGLVLEATWSNGSVTEITEDYTLEGYDPDVVGQQTLTVSYGGKTAEFTVMVAKVIASGEIGDNVIWELSNVGLVIISGTGAMWDGPGIYAWNGNPEMIKSVIIKPGVTSIGNSVFAACTDMIDVTIPESVTRIGEKAFSRCGVLDVCYTGTKEQWENITIESGNEGLLNASVHLNFFPFLKLTIKNQPYKTVYEFGAELDITGLTLEAVGFDGKRAVITVGYTVNGYDPLCAGVQILTVSYRDRTMEFAVTVQEGFVSGTCGDNAFWELNGQGVLTISGTGPMWNYNSDEPEWSDFADGIKTVVIKSGVTKIGDGAFAFCGNLTDVAIPDSVTSIGIYAFYFCSSLISVDIPDGISRIDDFTFWGDSSLVSVELPDSLVSIGAYAFCDCSSLVNVIIPDGVTIIDDYAFAHCQSLTDIEIPDSITRVGPDAFAECTVLKYNICDNGGYLGNSRSPYVLLCEFASSDITSHIVHNDTKVIYSGAGLGTLESIVIPEGLISVTDWAFDGRSELLDVYYCGTKAQWDAISIESENDPLLNATLHTDFVPIAEIKVKQLPQKTVYMFGEPLDTTGLELEATGLDGQIWELNESYRITGYDSVSSGEQTLTVSYGGKTASFTVLVKRQVVASGVCGDNAFWELDDLGFMTISGIGSIWDFYRDDPGWTGKTDYIKTVIIQPGITRIGANAFEYCQNMTDIEIPDSVNDIGSSAFSCCSSLKSIVIPEGVTKVTSCLFTDCTSLEIVVLPDTVTEIEVYAFFCCYSLTDIEIPSGVTQIGVGAFQSCEGLTDIKLPYGLTYIGEYAFGSCYSLTDIEIPDSITAVGQDAFIQCTALNYNIHNNGRYLGNGRNPYVLLTGGTSDITTCIVHKDTKVIEPWAFYYGSLTSIFIPEGLVSIGESAFDGCNELSDVYYSGSKAQWDAISIESYNDCLLNATLHTEMSPISEIAVKNLPKKTVYGIGEALDSDGLVLQVTWFDGKITEVTEGYTVEGYDPNTVGKQTLTVSYGGKTAEFTVTVKDLIASGTCGDNVFWELDGQGVLTISGTGPMWDFPYNDKPWNDQRSEVNTVIIKQGVTTIGNNAFRDCENLTDIQIPEGVTSIGSYVFGYCSSLISIALPDGMTMIGDHAFEGCSSLTDIALPESITSIGSSVFGYCSSLTGIALPSSLTTIANGLFSYCKGLKSITLPDGVTSIGEYAFYACRSLVSIEIPDSVTNIDNYAFDDCDSLTFHVYSAAKYLGNSQNPYLALIKNTSKTMVGYKVHENTKVIGAGAFYKCENMATIEIPEGVTSIGGGAFMYCTNLKSIVLPNSVAALGDGVFQYSSNLKRVTLPAGITMISDHLFQGCICLSSVEIPDSITSIGENTFWECISLSSIEIPKSVTSIGRSAFNSCKALSDVYYTGTKAQWDAISIEQYNNYLLNATLHTEWSPVSEIAIKNLPDKTVYKIGEALDMDGLVLNVTWFDGKITEVTEGYTVEGYDPNTVGKQTLTVSYQKKTATFTVTVKKASASGTCGENLFWELDDHGTLTISGTGDMTDYHGNKAPWYGYRYDVKTIVVAQGVTSIGDSAFKGCKNLQCVIIAGSVTRIGKNAFNGCGKLKNITLPFVGGGAGQPLGYIFGNEEYDGGVATEQYYRVTRAVSEESNIYYIPASLKTVTVTGGNIQNGAFHNCSKLENVTIGDGVEHIAEGSFYGCSGLESLTVPFLGETVDDEAVTHMGRLFGTESYDGGVQTEAAPESAQDNYYIPAGLKNITVTGGEISQGAFYNCSTLADVKLGSGVTSIGTNAFGNCSSLTEITVPVTVTSIGNDVFSGCDSLQNVNYQGETTQWEQIDKGSGNDVLTDDTIVEAKPVVPNVMGANGTYYTTLAEAVAAAQTGETLKLCADITETLTIQKSLYLNLDGYDIDGAVTVVNGYMLYVFDTQTDDYTINDERGYGKISRIIGHVKGLPETSDAAQDGYLMITEGDGISFHRVNLQITAMTLRASQVGVYYKSTFAGDEVVARHVSRFGVALSVTGVPTEKVPGTLSWFEGFEPGSNDDDKNSTLLYGIMKPSRTAEENARNAAMPIYGRAYILTDDGRYLFGAAVSRSLQEQVEAADAMWSQLAFLQQMELAMLYQENVEVMQHWALPNLQAALTPQVAMLPRKEQLIA